MELYFKQPHLSAEQASEMMEKHLLGQGESVSRINPFRIRLSTGTFLWKGDVDIEFAKKEDHIVIKVDKNLFSGGMKSLISIMRSNKLAHKIESVARYLFENIVESK